VHGLLKFRRSRLIPPLESRALREVENTVTILQA
jgi:hypothetical protein